MIKLNKEHYFAFYDFVGEQKIVEIARTDEKEATKLAQEYGEKYSKGDSWDFILFKPSSDHIEVVS